MKNGMSEIISKILGFSLMMFSLARAADSLPPTAISKNRSCYLGENLEKKQVDVTKLKQFLQIFVVNLEKEKSGGKAEYKDMKVYLWNNQGKLEIKLSHGKSKTTVRTQFDFEQEIINLYFEELGMKLSCVNQMGYEKLENNSDKYMYPVLLNDESDLRRYPIGLDLKVEKDLRMAYRENNDKMREVFFQGGKQISKDLKKSDHPWCVLQVKSEFDENLVVSAGTTLPTYSIELSDNNDIYSVITYTLIDFSTGIRSRDHFRYSPFSFSCSFPKDYILTPKKLMKITDNFIQVILRHNP